MLLTEECPPPMIAHCYVFLTLSSWIGTVAWVWGKGVFMRLSSFVLTSILAKTFDVVGGHDVPEAATTEGTDQTLRPYVRPSPRDT